MTSNLERYRKDLEELIRTGQKLGHFINKKYNPKSYKKIKRKKELKEKNIDVKNLPNFRDGYQNWYTESLAIIKRLIPDRESDFVELYKKPKNRKKITNENYRIADYLAGLKISEAEMFQLEATIPYGIVTHLFHNQFTILKSARKRFESSLFDIKQLLQADLFDSELDAAEELNKKGFVRGAGAIAGVVLEGHLKEICNNHKIKVPQRNPNIKDFGHLLNSKNVIDLSKLKKIQYLAGLRNLCDHKKQADPTKEDITNLIKGVSEVIKNIP